MEPNRSRTFTINHTKKLNSKTQSTTSTDQHKLTKNEGFYKAFFIQKINKNIL